MRYLRTSGFFCDPCSEAFREREAGRLGDLDGPQAEFIARHVVGWRFSDTVAPVGVLALPAGASDCIAIGWASASSLGVNLTYAVAAGSQGLGLARRVTALALLELDESVGGLDPGAQVHAQYDSANQASAAVAAALGLVADPALELRCAMPAGRARHFLGASAAVPAALAAAAHVAQNLEVEPMARGGFTTGLAGAKGRSDWAPL